MCQQVCWYRNRLGYECNHVAVTKIVDFGMWQKACSLLYKPELWPEGSSCQNEISCVCIILSYWARVPCNLFVFPKWSSFDACNQQLDEWAALFSAKKEIAIMTWCRWIAVIISNEVWFPPGIAAAHWWLHWLDFSWHYKLTPLLAATSLHPIAYSVSDT